MHALFLWMVLILPTLEIATGSLPQNQQIQHISFLEDKLFYTTKSKKIFGFISSQTGEFMTQQQVKEGQAIIRVDSEYNKMFLRRGRDQIIVFRLSTLEIRELKFKVQFQHQRIVDIIETEHRVYALTNKDLRVYDINAVSMRQNPNSIISSCRKKEWFLKIIYLEANNELAIILLNDQEVCLRKLSLATKAVHQQCLFNLTSQILEIYQIKEGILIESKDLNYVIQTNQEVYSFKAQLSQVTHDHGLISSEFKTFLFKEIVKTPGLPVLGNNQQYQFWLKKGQEESIDLTVNGKLFWRIITQEVPLRCWVQSKGKGLFRLIIQWESNNLRMYQLNLSGGAVRELWPEARLLQMQEEL